MSFKSIIAAAISEYTDDLERALGGLTPEERRFRPTPEANHIDFIVWHIARVEDSIINRRIRRDQQIWEQDRWYEKLGMPQQGIGEGFSVRQVEDLPGFSFDELMEYYKAVRRQSLHLIDSLTDEDLTLIPDPDRPDQTIARILSHLLVEEAQHVGQIAYIRGIQRGFDG